ncbi:zinc-binding dehydrogenase [Agrobacterium sp.]|uniref:zinc-binding dehydrogenase n=1 Tax=Agrobacterium sp. TaxID=361 RepID=UPI0028AB0080|nr:zinc-binding dehydrogenase [Agrobacterium sp.]
MARAWVINSYSGYQGLSFVDVPVEQPGPGEIRLRVEAFALNWGDMDLMLDNYSFSFHDFPARIGMEAAGIVEAVGEGVDGIAIGERYCTLPYFYYQRGASTETLIIDASYVTPAPDGLSAVESASIWMQYMTAYFPLAEISKVGAGNHVLATAATSTAGTASLEIGRILGATMIGTTRFAANRDYLQTKGADHVVVTDGKGPSVAEQLLEMTGGKGIDAAFDPVGETMIAQYSPALARNARIYFYGTLDTKPPVLPMKDMFQKNATFQPYSLFNYVENPDMCARGKAFVYKHLKDGRIKPSIDRVYPMEEYKQAWDYLRQPRTSHGKVVIKTGL